MLYNICRQNISDKFDVLKNTIFHIKVFSKFFLYIKTFSSPGAKVSLVSSEELWKERE